jgi:RNA polymerase sigma-70 factor (ECF subfamily)
MSMNETTYIQEVLGGQIDSFAPLVDRYHVGLILYCEQFMRNRSAAEDITQDIFVTAYQRLSSYNPERGAFSTWLYQLARTRCLDECRRQKIHIDIDTLPDLASMTQPITEAEKNEIRAAVDELQPPVYRQVIQAYYWQGKSYAEIAQEFDLPIGTVRTNLRRAKQQLKGVLA